MSKRLLPFMFLTVLSWLFVTERASAGILITRPQAVLGMVGYWTFDGADVNWTTNIASDRSGQGNNGNITSMSTTTAPVAGKLGQALSFDGTNDYVDVGSSDSLNPTGELSISAWAKWDVIDANDSWVVARDDAALGRSYTFGRSGSYLWLQINGGATIQDSVPALSPGVWYHIAVTGSPSTGWNTYINGQFSRSAAWAAPNTTTGPTNIGRRSYLNAPGYMDGLIDDVRIYNRALSAAEVKQLYLAGSARVNTSQNIRFRDSSLVGEWSFDGPDVSFTANKAYDRSGQGNDGTLTNMATSTAPAIGKLGQALKFDGSNDVVTMSHIDQNGEMTISAWINTNTVAAGTVRIVSDSNGASASDYHFELNRTAGKLSASWYNGSSAYATGNTALSVNTWYHAVMVRSGSTSNWTATLYLNGANDGSGTTVTDPNGGGGGTSIGRTGSISTSFFSGLIDEVRVYNRALTAAEVKQLYLAGSVRANTSRNIRLRDSSLVGEWSFDGPDVSFTANKAYDRSGQGNDGTLTNMATTTAPVAGKLGQALKFDGSNDFVSVNASATLDDLPALTFSVWMSPRTMASGDTDKIIQKGVGGTQRIAFHNGTTSRQINFQVDYDVTDLSRTTNALITLGAWNHVVVTWDGTSVSTGIKLYISGIEATYSSSVNGSGNRVSDANLSLAIGANSSGTFAFDGLIDDVRVYNRALSASEVKQLYLLGR